tara:strand:+ start:817 stop:1062 length:246 start_codon:yes stop_codon:yes gene_type:complete
MNEIKINHTTEYLVFKTNIEDNYQACRLAYVLEKTDGITDWNLDLDDWENILKIEFSYIQIDHLIQHLLQFNIEVEELPIW